MPTTYLSYASSSAPSLQQPKDFHVLNIRTPSPSRLAPAASVPVPVAEGLKGGNVGTAYSETIGTQGGTSPYTYAVTTGSLPTSTTLNASTGVISGTPTVAATSTFTITVTDAVGFTGSQVFQIVIDVPSSGSGGSYTFLA